MTYRTILVGRQVIQVFAGTNSRRVTLRTIVDIDAYMIKHRTDEFIGGMADRTIFSGRQMC